MSYEPTKLRLSPWILALLLTACTAVDPTAAPGNNGGSLGAGEGAGPDGGPFGPAWDSDASTEDDEDASQDDGFTALFGPGDAGVSDDGSASAADAESPDAETCPRGHAGPDCMRCAAGYQDRDEDGQCLPSCAGGGDVLAYDCSDYGTCADRSGMRECQCEAGYTGKHWDDGGVQMRLGELIYFNEDIGNTKLAEVITYLHAKWKVPLIAP